MTKLVFVGTSASSVSIPEGLVESGYEIQTVATQPGRSVGWKRVTTLTPIKEVTLKYDIRALQPEEASGSSETEEIIELVPDLIVTIAFGQFLSEKLPQVPKLGATNVHASLLPKYREGVPVYYAIMNGKEEAGVVIMEMIKKMDTGGICAQESMPITKQGDVGTMSEKLSLLGKKLLSEMSSNILNGQKSVPQDRSRAASSPNVTREQEAVDWHKTAGEINDQARRMCPWPTTLTTYEGTRWRLLPAEVLAEGTDGIPGTITRKDKGNLWIAYGKQTVLTIDELRPASKGKQAVHDFLSGSSWQVQIGQQVE